MGHTLTTRPSARTDRVESRPRATHVRWTFPASAVTAMVRRAVVGRDESCDTVLQGSEISRRHAEFRVDGPLVAVRDLDSRNGVFVNGMRHTDAPLEAGDVVRCGEWIGVVVAEDAHAPGFHQIAPGWYGGARLAHALEAARRVAGDLPVVIQGETGTGKEGLARALHLWSGRAGPLVAVNCAALPANLAEAELFGFRKGAFSGAEKASSGLFRGAHGGSLFLDEILDLPIALQPKLLRVLEDGRVRALGETRDVSVDVRVIGATQEPLCRAVADGRFRADLHARLDGLTVVLPPLRERREDIAPLFLELARRHAASPMPEIQPKLVEALCLYDWPLNVRELVMLVRRLLSVHRGKGELERAHLPARMTQRGARLPPSRGDKPTRRKTANEAEFEALVEALRNHGGSVARAAEAIGVGRARAYRVLSAHPGFSLDKVRG